MKKIVSSSDNFFLTRWLLIPYIQQLFRLSRTSEAQSPEFPAPRFDIFRKIDQNKSSIIEKFASETQKQTYGLLYSLIKAHSSEIFLGFIVCLLWTLLNTLTPKIVKEFFRLMKDTTIEGTERSQANYLTQKFIVLQILRLLTSANTKRLFGQLAFKVTGALSIKLVQKSLKLSNDCRQLLPQSQIYQTENTDMKAVANFFKELWVVTQIPFTIISSILLLFSERISFGIVGLYWIILIFFFQAWLTDLMVQSTNRKLRLTQQRCITNYQLMEKMPQARLDQSQEYFLERNNDFFLSEVRQYHRFHRFMTYFDISLIIMPLIFVISLSFYDYNETTSFTIEEVYILMSLIGLCYRPFKNLKKFNLIMSEGLYSLRRFSIFFSLPQKRKSLMIKNDELLTPKLQIKSHTITYSLVNLEKSTGFYVDKPISVQSGERLYVLGKRGQGISQFLKSILADFETLKGQICLEGSFAYLPRQNFFLPGTLSQNIAFYDSSKTSEQINEIYRKLALDQDFQIRGGLQGKIDISTLTERELKKIGLARVIIAKRNVIVLDCPFLGLQYSTAEALDQLLRQKQAEGAIVIIAERYIKFQQSHDQILIVSKGQIQEYGRLEQVLSNNQPLINEFKQVQTMSLSDRISCLNIVREFQAKIRKIVFLSQIMQGEPKTVRQVRQKKMIQLCKVIGRYSLKLKEKSERKAKLEKKQSKNPIQLYVHRLFKYVSLTDWLWGGLALVSIEILYVFIQYKFGQQYKEGGKAKFSSIRELMKYELALAIGLAALIHIFREIQFCISSIIANHVYKDSINSILKKKISWYNRSHPSLIAHKYNHDYDEIFNLVHSFFNFVKLILVFLYTVISIDTSGRTAATLTFITTLVYFGLLQTYRRAQDNMIRSYPTYKYEFVKVFDEIIEGAFTINIFGKDKQATDKAKMGLINVTAFRLSSTNIQIAQEAILELTGSIIVALGLEYGTKVKLIQGDHNEALVAVSVMLLLNLSDVLKNIHKALIKMDSLFRLKLYSYVEPIDLNPVELINIHMPRNYAIDIKEKLLQTPEDNLFQIYPLTLKIECDEKLLILQKDSVIRKNLVLGLTNNLVDPIDTHRHLYIDIIRMGGQPLKQLAKNDLRRIIATLLPDNFYFSGTLADNLRWKMHHFNTVRALRLAQQFKLSQDLPEFEALGLVTPINGQTKNKELSRKIALLKILLKRPKIVVIKDTPWIIAGRNVVDWLRQEDIQCTIIGISETPIGVEGAQRVIMMQKGKILQSGSSEDLKKDPLSLSGQLLRSAERERIEMWRAQKEEDPLIIKRQRRQLLRAIVQYSLERR